jgi:hypothetical protein
VVGKISLGGEDPLPVVLVLEKLTFETSVTLTS